MECRRSRSVVSIMEPLPGGRSHTLSAMPLVPVPGKSLSFSISAILGLKDDCKNPELPNNERNTQPPELREHIQSPQHSHSDTSPQSPPYSDNTSSTSSCNSEPDVSPDAEKPAKKKRKRTTFSTIEVWELERAYKRRPYLMSEDEEDLVQRLGIPARSLKYWYQNRRAKSRKEEGTNSASITRQTNNSNQFGPPVSRLCMETWQLQRPLFPVSHASHEFLQVQSNRSHQLNQTSQAPVNHRFAFKSTHLRHYRSFQFPIFHQEQFTPVANAAKLPFRPAFHRYKPY